MNEKKKRTMLGFDFETAALPDDNDTPPFPVEIACILIDEKTLEVFGSYHKYIKVPASVEISPDAVKTHGLTREWLEVNGVHWWDARTGLIEWLAGNGYHCPDGVSGYDDKRKNQLIPFGQNVIQFDTPILRRFLGHPQKNILSRYGVDTMCITGFVNQTCKTLYGWDGMPFRDPVTGNPSASLAAQMALFDIAADGHHGAEFDILATLECYRQHIRNYSTDLEKAQAFDAAGLSLPEPIKPVW